jgi:IS5 family transposase
MKQMSLSETGFERKTKRTRKREFLDEMNLVVPWAELVSLIAPHAPLPGTRGGRPPFAVDAMLRIHFLQQWFNLSDPAMEEALYDTPMFREFAGWMWEKTTCPTRAPSCAFATCSKRTT